ncbi:VOC family protein [Phenylobacterium sp. J367]|uniref:VOC family protein n=1 Tax=Phenylobacterium sp. J367 TaxID=2898435 RepID=UPI0021517010|nr:VOC family protein [Phenylobacterium sp. J367]MCR5879107.1 VOC family protein [Phenylobacterium sp. J367]
MTQRLSLTALLVRDYAEARDFYVGKVGFDLVEDTDMGGGKRWVVVRPPGSDAGLLLAKANAEQARAVGDQAAGRVFLFLETDDFDRDHARMTAAGVRFLEEPRREPYGTVAVFEDLYGAKWDLIQRAPAAAAAPPR